MLTPLAPFEIKALLGNDNPIDDEQIDQVRNSGIEEQHDINQLPPQTSQETLALVDDAIGRPGEASSKDELQQQSDAARAAKAQPQTEQASNPAPAGVPKGPDGIPDKEREDLDYYLATKGMEGEDMLNKPEHAQAQEEKAPAQEEAQPQVTEKKWVDGQGWVEVPVQARPGSGASSGKNGIVSTAPNWYDYLAPPDNTDNQIAGTLLGGLLKGIMGAAAAQSAAGRHHRKGAGAEGFMKNFIEGGIAPAMGQIVNQPEQQYQNKLAAAKAQADMHAKLAAHNDSLAAERLKLAQEKWLATQQANAEKAALAAELEDPNSEASRKQQQALIDQLANPTEEDIAAIHTRPGSILLKYRAQYGNQASQARGLVNALKMHNVRTDTQAEMKAVDDAYWRQHHDIETETGKQKEERLRQAGLEEAEIPGLEFTGKRAPSAADVGKAREVMDAVGRAHLAATKLTELQSKLNAGRVSGRIYKYFANDPEGKQALSDAHWYQKALMDAQREMSKLGVLQGFEKEMIETYNPDAESLDAFFNGRFNYNTYQRALPDYANARLKAYGYRVPKDSEMYAPVAPVEEVQIVPELQKMGQTNSKAAQNAAAAVEQVVKNAGNTAETIAPDAVKTAKDALAKAQAEYNRLTGGGKGKQAPAPAQPKSEEPKDHHVRVTIQNGQGVPPTVEEHMVTKTEYVRALRKARQQQGTRVELLSQ